MKFHLFPAILLSIIGALAPDPVAAAADPRASYTTHGVTVRLHALPADANGMIKGALSFELEPGWKTYWLNPGQTGLAPMLDFSGSSFSSPPQLSFPVPERYEDAYSSSIVYSQPMAIAFAAPAATGESRLKLAATFGICDTVCVPAATTLELDVPQHPSPGDIAAVKAAFAALPDEATQPLVAHIDGNTLFVANPLSSTPDSIADIFVAAADWQFAPLETAGISDDHEQLKLMVDTRPKAHPPTIEADILIVDGEFARIWRGVTIPVQ
ncbi:hypothetical protein FPY71_05225 [Aureimonas fodinaquatilis]|uniref:Thiol:disulfide interchange protein DsbD N-terminal domain-containing protein n=1 Tax=Aureimonas fodinaquatilis TaxID=2565783 RepID=A0A5B0E3Z5_9HYPH|nr:protein-disulfide reductase DsbD domain-containing protein [Aureimonas fodinaquatilis]KAA0972490.1 hypothetical protein FPY71_05225 [Aureimonas fodinaquatilis]